MSKVIRRRKDTARSTLVLRMSPGDGILIGNDVEVFLSEVEGKRRLKIAIIAPPETKVRRKKFEEARDKVQGEGTSKA
jgi:sRNA-binding carbon storage regulator CsrA